MSITILSGDCRDVLRTLPDESVQCVVTSPPYFGLRDYGVIGQIGLEPTPDAFVAEMIAVFREVRRALRSDGTLWLNLGDSYASGEIGRHDALGSVSGTAGITYKGLGIAQEGKRNQVKQATGLPPKNLLGIPWRVAFALQADGWWLRQDIIWSKPNPMPESMTDRCTKAHEYIFLLTKSASYAFDAKAIAEPAIYSGLANQTASGYKDAEMFNGKRRSARDNFRRNGSKREKPMHGQSVGTHRPDRDDSVYDVATRNKRSVWEVATAPFPGAHFATFPPALIEPCILAGCPEGGTVLDPFGGAGTTGLVADRMGRNAILIELNPDYVAIAEKRLRKDGGMFTDVRIPPPPTQNEGSGK